MTYRIGSRGSRLALLQTGLVKARMEQAYPRDRFEIVTVETKGDRIADRPIAVIGDTALFTHEIERALQEGRIDLAVHSMKDLPAACAEGLVLAKAWVREDPRDVLVLRKGLSSFGNLPQGAVVATGSPRRNVLLKRLRPDLRIVGIRGNVDTRLRKLFEPTSDEPRLDGIVLAAAGLKRLGREDVVAQHLDAETMLPAPNQGQLAIELRVGDAELKAKVDALGSDEAETVAAAERGFLREIGADCHMPVGALAQIGEVGIRLRCVFARGEDEPPVFADVVGRTSVEAARKAAAEIRRQLAGEVTLVGAGPGDPGLITVRGLEALKKADVIVYDRLVDDTLLRAAKPGCELVYAGKSSGNHTLPQAEINALLVRKALTCRLVVRLKGGDPFVFGRGGEEAEYLLERGVRCTVVPGVTSAIAVPASAGIPVTHRGVAQGFEVVTAHAKDDEPIDIDFSRMLDSNRTYVFLMGLKHVAEIAASLVAAGRAVETPAAVVSAGTTSGARCVTGTLADIAARTAAAALASPAVLIVGETVKLRRRLGFPLSGRKVLVPEIEGGRSRLAALLTALGADVDALPVGRIVAIPGAVTAQSLADVTWLAFTSRNGLLPFDEPLVRTVRRRNIRIAAIGPATAAAAAERGLPSDFISRQSTGEGMLAEFKAILTASDRVLHPTADGGRDALAGIGDVCRYQSAGVYRNEAVPLEEPVNLDRYDAAAFTCASSVRRVYARATGATCAVAIGPTTGKALERSGVKRMALADSPALESLVARIAELLDGDVSVSSRLPTLPRNGKESE